MCSGLEILTIVSMKIIMYVLELLARMMMGLLCMYHKHIDNFGICLFCLILIHLIVTSWSCEY